MGSGASKVLMSQGITFWLKSLNIAFPCELLALAYSANAKQGGSQISFGSDILNELRIEWRFPNGLLSVGPS